MILLLLTYLFKKFGHKLKLGALLQKPRYAMALQPIRVQNVSVIQKLNSGNV